MSETLIDSQGDLWIYYEEFGMWNLFMDGFPTWFFRTEDDIEQMWGPVLYV